MKGAPGSHGRAIRKAKIIESKLMPSSQATVAWGSAELGPIGMLTVEIILKYKKKKLTIISLHPIKKRSGQTEGEINIFLKNVE